MKKYLLLLAAIGILPFACGTETTSEYMCDVVLSILPSKFNGVAVSPEGEATGQGVASTREEALSIAYKNACDQFTLPTLERAKCERGESFLIGADNSSVEGRRVVISGNINVGGGLFINGREVTPEEMYAFFSQASFTSQSCRGGEETKRTLF